jgi:hypothetical protein
MNLIAIIAKQRAKVYIVIIKSKVTNKGVVMFYAEFCPRGITTITDSDTLVQFETKRERDEMVERINSADCSTRAQAVTRREVAHRYNFNDFNGERCREVYGLKTCCDKYFWEIPHRIGYAY